MIDLSRSTFDSMVRVTRRGPDKYLELELHVPTFERTFPLEICVANGSDVASENTIRTVLEIANMSPEARVRIRKLLHEDAVRARHEVAYGDPNPPLEVPPSGLLRRLLWRPNKYRFVPLSQDDPRHPCYFVNGLEGVEGKVEWLKFRIDENETTTHRFARLDFRPAWEEEHGASVVFRSGVPVGVTDSDASLEEYDGV